MTFSTSLVAVWYSSDLLKIARAGLQRTIRLGAGDGDHRLLGEGFQQFDLAVGEAAGFLGGNRNNADRHAVSHQRYQHVRSVPKFANEACELAVGL